MRQVPEIREVRVSLLQALHPPGNLAAKGSVDAAPNAEAPGWSDLAAAGQLLEADGPGLWTYRIVREGVSTLGLVLAVDLEPGDADASAGFVAELPSAHADLPAETLEAMRLSTSERPLFHFRAADGSTHTGWRIADSAGAFAPIAGLRTLAFAASPSGSRFACRLVSPDQPILAPRLGLFLRRLGAATPPPRPRS